MECRLATMMMLRDTTTFSPKKQMGGMPVFVGQRRQRGHRISNVLGGLIHRVVGFLGSYGLDF